MKILEKLKNDYSKYNISESFAADADYSEMAINWYVPQS